MHIQDSHTPLNSIRRNYMRTKLLLYGLQALAAAGLSVVLFLKWGVEVPLLAFIAIATVLGAVLYFGWRWFIIRKASLHQVARHLNRNYPQLEDSTELLLKPEEELNLLERLQQQKVKIRINQILGRDKKVFRLQPTPTYLGFGLALVVSAGIVYLPASPLSSLATPPGQVQIAFPDTPAAASDTAVTIQQIAIRVTPPPYTGKKSYTAESPNLRIEQGATVAWRISTSRKAERLDLVVNEATSLKKSKLKDTHSFSGTFTEPALYHLNLNGQKSAYYTLEIIPDEAPVIQIIKPEQYTEILFGDPQRVTLQAQLSDDYGIREANMVATVAKGTGEAVKFREEKFSLGFSGTRRTYTAQQTLDLQKLGMTYGDELYFYIQAWDNHKGYTRSETYFVQVEDTTITESMDDFAMGVNPVPEYFRSQRQIIIDTEKLVAEQKKLTGAVLGERSNAIGVDQKLLRLRYGKFLGEEFESGIGPGGGIPEGEEGHHEDDGHDHQNHGTAESRTKAEELLDTYTHKHDQEEEATFFEPAVKAKLQGALAQMWEAELRLRMHKPKEALPFEYKALRMLKEVQQSTRAYAAKTGFDPPPLKEPELRLTGDLTKITAPADRRTEDIRTTLPNTRAALQWLERQKSGGANLQADAALLERAGQELAQEALQKPGRYLRAMQDLRTLIQDTHQGRTLCSSCLATVEKAWHTLLPPAKASPQKQSTSRSSLAQQYLKQLNTK